MPDDVLRELMAPVEPAEINRDTDSSVVGFYSDGPYEYKLLYRVREWEKNFAIPLREEKAKKAAAGSHLLDTGEANIRFVQDWLGHANIQNTVIYASLVSATRERKAREHFFKLPKF